MAKNSLSFLPMLCGVLLLSFGVMGLMNSAPPSAPPQEAGPAPRVANAPPPPGISDEVRFMRQFIARVNPPLVVEDEACASLLPGAIHHYAQAHGLDWQGLLALAWQESDFDCHAKNRRDKGGAYGPFQIRRLWEPVTGDPRPRYFDPELAVERVVQVMKYYRETRRYERLVERHFSNPLLCLYNSGETLRVNMGYCRQIGRKLRQVRRAWQAFRHLERAQVTGEASPAPNA